MQRKACRPCGGPPRSPWRSSALQRKRRQASGGWSPLERPGPSSAGSATKQRQASGGWSPLERKQQATLSCVHTFWVQSGHLQAEGRAPQGGEQAVCVTKGGAR